jgi:hypothetical protein
MKIDGWKYYNHAAIPTTAPHEKSNMAPINDGSIWKIEGATPLLARWTTDFDCGYETNWWYVIKDTPFDVNALKAKRRYEINKGIKNFDVKKIEPTNYAVELYNIQIAAYTAYPEKYRPSVDREEFLSSVQKWDCFICIGAFDRESGKLCGYALLSKESEIYVDFKVMRTNPKCEKNGVNAALVEGILKYLNSFLTQGGYICDGARSINHETAFQDYLEKYFGFRKVYCKLHIEYNPKLKWAVRLIYPMRRILLKMDGIGKIHQLNAVLRMEEMARGKYE